MKHFGRLGEISVDQIALESCFEPGVCHRQLPVFLLRSGPFDRLKCENSLVQLDLPEVLWAEYAQVKHRCQLQEQEGSS